MHVRLGLIALLTAALLTAGAAAAGKRNVSGTWTSVIKQRNAKAPRRTTTFNLTQTGTKLTGTVTGPGGKTFTIKHGTVRAGRVAMQVTFVGPEGLKVTWRYVGVLRGTTIVGVAQAVSNGKKRQRTWQIIRAD